jgi:hypothetical protein
VRGRTIALGGLAIAILVALIALAIAVRRPPPLELPEDRLQEARRAHEQRRSSAPPPAAPASAPGEPPAVPLAPGPAGAPGALPAASAHTHGHTDPDPAAPTAPPADLNARMDEANRFYDQRMYEEAQEAAQVILNEHPGNVRMLRIVVSTACIMGDVDKARRYNEILPAADQEQMRARCSKFGLEL